MKTLFKLSMLCTVVLSACIAENDSVETILTDEYVLENTPKEDHTLENRPIEDQTFFLPNNKSNPYDFIGNVFLLALQQQVQSDETEGQMIGMESSASKSRKESIDDLWKLIDRAPLSPPAHKALVGFITKVLDQKGKEYKDIHLYIVDFEDQILNSDVYSPEDQRIILSFSSIIRFASYQVRLLSDRNDDDWDISIGNMIRWLSAVIADTYLDFDAY